MGRVLFFALLVGLAVWLLFGRSRRIERRDDAKRAPKAGAEAMIACAHCGVHLPRTDAVSDDAHSYCGDAHRRLGPRRP